MYEIVCVFVYEFQDGEKEPLMPITKSPSPQPKPAAPSPPKPKVANKQALQTQALCIDIYHIIICI